MHKRNIRYFLLTLIMALLIILPTFALIGAYSITRVRSVAEPVGDVPATRPTEEDDRNILLIVEGESTAFMLIKFDAFGGSVVSLAMPDNLILSGDATVKSVLERGGPAMVTVELEKLLEVGIDYYCMLNESQLATLTLNLKPATPSSEIQERIDIPSGHVLSYDYAQELIAKATDGEQLLVRSVCYSLLLEANMEIMQAEIPARVNELPGDINSNIGSEGLYRLTKIFSLLPYETVNYYAATLSGDEVMINDDGNNTGVIINENDKNKAAELLN